MTSNLSKVFIQLFKIIIFILLLLTSILGMFEFLNYIGQTGGRNLSFSGVLLDFALMLFSLYFYLRGATDFQRFLSHVAIEKGLKMPFLK
ncbi:hypothetical protein FGO68_gene5997 [Halteria grandinella]|uniref:Uncharacterized protein n=1 Tax=Halteria grandinella TaxID=5974 RepID=A0A8J8NIV8_HALGN|nr:hypothetical protein FGO68_gene5997 [Halteria grandinella]